MREALDMCYDRFLPDESPNESMSMPERLVLLNSAMFDPGTVITCSFVGGSSSQRQNAIKAAAEITKYANLKFNFLDSGVGMFRIAFNPSLGAWSYLGRQCLSVPKSQPTMNLGFDQAGTYVHEFMHGACAAVHEHSSPNDNPIQWNVEQVYADLSGPPNNWDRATIDSNVISRYSQTQTNGTSFDPNSIMLYAFPRTWTLDGYQTHSNPVLSPTDIAWLRKKYPYPDAPPPPVDPTPGGYDLVKTITFRVTGQGPKPTITIT